jgi:hypothetical protein
MFKFLFLLKIYSTINVNYSLFSGGGGIIAFAQPPRGGATLPLGFGGIGLVGLGLPLGLNGVGVSGVREPTKTLSGNRIRVSTTLLA